MNRFTVLMVMGTVLALLVNGVGAAATDTDDLVAALVNIPAAEMYQYQTRDDQGRSMDCLKVFQVGDGDYRGLYHGFHDGVFSVHLARSADLLAWSHVVQLDEHASQATVWVDDGSYLMAYEKDEPNSCWMRLRRYKGIDALTQGVFSWEHDIPRSLAPTAEGTPSFEWVRQSSHASNGLDIGFRFHYFKDIRVDQLARGTLTDSTTWRAWPSDNLNKIFIGLGVHGNIGDRDRFTWNGRMFYLQECQLERLDWSSWRVFLCDADGMPLMRLPIKTHAGSRSFCNPNVTPIRDKRGREKLVVTLFVPSEGSGPNESGSLIYVVDANGTARSAE